MTTHKVLDFTTNNQYNKNYDCYIVCGNKKYKCNKDTLTKIGYFKRYFNGNFKLNLINNNPCCKFDNKYNKLIPIFLTSLYMDKVISNNRLLQLINFYDYISYFDIINKLINKFILSETIDFNILVSIIDYINDKELILTNINYNNIYNILIDKYITNQNIELIDITNPNIELIDKINYDIFKLNTNHSPIIYVKCIEFLYDKIGANALYDIDFSKLRNIDKSMYSTVSSYISSMNIYSPVKNYLIVGYLDYIRNIEPGYIEITEIMDALDSI